MLRGALHSTSDQLSASVELTLGLRQRPEERLCRHRAGSRPTSALQGAPLPASSLPQNSSGPSSERSVGPSSRSEEREREISLRLTVGLGSSPQRTMIHLRTVAPARRDTRSVHIFSLRELTSADPRPSSALLGARPSTSGSRRESLDSSSSASRRTDLQAPRSPSGGRATLPPSPA
jgi:hypothetical protein